MPDGMDMKLEHRDSEGTLHSSTLATLDRPELRDEAGLGLSHDTENWIETGGNVNASLGCGRLFITPSDSAISTLKRDSGDMAAPCAAFDGTCGTTGDPGMLAG
jgi:hypothetical protein